jgi:hypothetical protein
LNEATSTLDDNTLLSGVPQLSGVIAAYRLLLLLPVEYMSRSSRADFIKRALVADDLFSHLSVDASNHMDQSLIILRMFLKRLLTHGGYVEQPVGSSLFGQTILFIGLRQAERLFTYLEHLLTAPDLHSQPSSTYVSVTVDVIEMHLR